MRSKFELTLFALGLALVVSGMAMIYKPSAYIGGGLLLIILSMVSRKNP